MNNSTEPKTTSGARAVLGLSEDFFFGTNPADKDKRAPATD